MNKKQLIVMWIGIIVFFSIGELTRTRFGGNLVRLRRGGMKTLPYYNNYAPLVNRLGCTALVAAGLIVTFRGKEK